ncbi:hypothetical protein DM860_006996 [Cuscuta australis]|uniref:Bifunctional inhibitor/plant lipid transfer protein/seed storage helical domain-containing protein n=1 Tax=Cuscuta australis TaxID=267555 RepID=A0A328E5M0_9ASTE|nr:hypothetical protein DM860_006996 [Cuscuta australis]
MGLLMIILMCACFSEVAVARKYLKPIFPVPPPCTGAGCLPMPTTPYNRGCSPSQRCRATPPPNGQKYNLLNNTIAE